MSVVLQASGLVKQVSLAVVPVVLLSISGVHADPVDEVAPLPPWALTAESTAEGVELSWNAPPSPVDGYNVYRATDVEAVLLDGLNAFVLIGHTTDLTYLDGTSTVDSPIYVVTATDGGDESRPSNPGGYPYCLSVDPDCFWPPPL